MAFKTASIFLPTAGQSGVTSQPSMCCCAVEVRAQPAQQCWRQAMPSTTPEVLCLHTSSCSRRAPICPGTHGCFSYPRAVATPVWITESSPECRFSEKTCNFGIKELNVIAEKVFISSIARFLMNLFIILFIVFLLAAPRVCTSKLIMLSCSMERVLCSHLAQYILLPMVQMEKHCSEELLYLYWQFFSLSFCLSVFSPSSAYSTFHQLSKGKTHCMTE